MVRFLNRTNVRVEIRKLIKNSDTDLTIISPYLKLNNTLIELLNNCIDRGCRITILHRDEINKEEEQKLLSIKGIRIYTNKDLHAKCYYNNEKAIVTSMNLHDYSLKNNIEIGILVEKELDEDLYQDIVETMDTVISDTRETSKTIKKSENFETRIEKEELNPSLSRKGYCIRCGETIEYNPENPYCEKHLKSWKRYKNPDYIEKNGHCHICGIDFEASMNEPICSKCLSNNRKNGNNILKNALKDLMDGYRSSMR